MSAITVKQALSTAQTLVKEEWEEQHTTQANGSKCGDVPTHVLSVGSSSTSDLSNSYKSSPCEGEEPAAGCILSTKVDDASGEDGTIDFTSSCSSSLSCDSSQ